MIIIGKRIKFLRKTNNITQLELANILNVSRATVNNWERGNSFPGDDIKIKLANYFKVSIDYLLGYSDNTNSNLNLDVLIHENKILKDKLNKINKISNELYRGD